jgi:signal transduction histidine kinase
MHNKRYKQFIKSFVFSGSLLVTLISLSLLLLPISISIISILISLLSFLFYNINVVKNNFLLYEEQQTKQISCLELEIAKVEVIDNIQQEKDQIKEELTRSTSFNHHLSGVIAGLNHELSPWISGIYVLSNRLKLTEENQHKKDSLTKIEMASIQLSELLNNLSKSINKVKNFSVFKSNIKETVASWIQLVLLESSIKDKITKDNISVDLDSLDFVAEHSPMYLSQIILNLAKNSIDHNGHMLERLKIKIYGDIESKYLIYEDNGKGIHSEILSKVFNNFGVTTKKCDNGEIHGFGLYACLNYCVSMRAIITAESVENVCTRFIIKFERINDNNEVDISTNYKYSSK